MFKNELSHVQEVRRLGAEKGLAYYADINEYTHLFGPSDGPRPKEPDTPKLTNKQKQQEPVFADSSLSGRRVLFDLNEHFIEMSNAGEELRSLTFMLLFMAALVLGLPMIGLSSIFHEALFSSDWFIDFCIGGGMLLIVLVGLFYAWRYIFSAIFFTALCPRYRFNRTTGKVYVVRPKKFGGNAVLDWARVKAHVNWAPPKSWEAEELEQSAEARQARYLSSFGGEGSLVLYWPPLDAADPARKGEDVLWVGPTGSGEALWQYIRTFMQSGMRAVPAPGPDNWLRKGFSNAVAHLEEGVMQSSHQRDALQGKATSGMTAFNYAANAPWAPLHSLAERLCYWPRFPEEWNSDCGQKRRESGLGPEEPLRWKAK
jgi:hypothetical protein